MFERQAVAKALLLVGELTGITNTPPAPKIPDPAPRGITASSQVVPGSPLGNSQLPQAATQSKGVRGLADSSLPVDSLAALSLPARPGAALNGQLTPPSRILGGLTEDPLQMDKLRGTQFELIAWQEPDNKPAPVPKPLEARTEAELKQTLKEKMREYVFKMVNLYWKEHDLKTYGYWDQDGDGLADRLDQDSYNGHGVGKAYAKPIPGAREDGHYNCEYFAQNFWLAFRDVFYESNPKSQCWKLEYDGHATIAFYFEHKGESIYVFLEPQGGSSWFISLPQLPLNEMPARGSSRNVRGIMCHNLEENSWTGVERYPGSKPLPKGILDQLLDGKPLPGNRPLEGRRTPGDRPVKAEEANNPKKK